MDPRNPLPVVQCETTQSLERGRKIGGVAVEVIEAYFTSSSHGKGTSDTHSHNYILYNGKKEVKLFVYSSVIYTLIKALSSNFTLQLPLYLVIEHFIP